MTDWQPIETAPKMKSILLFAVTDIAEDGTVRNWKMETGFWHSGYAVDTDNNELGHLPWNWGGYQLRVFDVQPTHWQPLPEPPK